MSYVKIEELVGQTFKSVIGKAGDDELDFVTDTHIYRMYHKQDCCESVWLDDIVGDLDDLVGSEITFATEETNRDEEEPPAINDGWQDDSYTWTFYKIGTNKGSVTLRWYGTSNGYYSESVDIIKIENSK